ncbi:ParB/RepB/Spo0J family partition protein [Paenibacillus eucommiae]|uniref:ParB family chromosome partitioning protein n=1 Tax=Paenibacillus eucommiae TaxID=1355755 RepID=A0ABS4IY38_9BACL|nr:ParB/RepB/Spo0J family partition protein [Paenibacillus eucommiae]MBP1991796.1 ParB family chromosome partitioning protein [Paenibacillus eucommiae]
MDIIEIMTDLIDEDTDQPRNYFDEESLQELMKSVEELGLLSPIKVRTTSNGRYKIIYGNRRYKACKALGRKAIPCIVSTATDELEIYLEQIAENLTREGFSPIEEAEAFHKLMNDPKFSSSTKYLSSKLGKPEAYIKNKCDLLKFSNAVKKRIVGGTEIRKDKLTEDQLLPLKDLPMEHRDSLALIIAKDEMPVSDVKKIARLFKDKDISSGTKDKLLYKSGHELLETWSVYEQNKAERAKAAQPKAATKSEKPKKTDPSPAAMTTSTGGTESAIATTAPAPTGSIADNVNTVNIVNAVSTVNSVNPANMANMTTTANIAALPTMATPIETKLQRLLASLPENNDLSADNINSYEEINGNDRDHFLSGVDALIENLEKHLAEWKKVRSLASESTNK